MKLWKSVFPLPMCDRLPVCLKDTLPCCMSVLPGFPETNLVRSKHFVLRRAERKEKRNEWKSQQSFSKQDNLSLISYLLNASIREQQLYVSLISFPRTRSVFYPLGSLTAKTNPQQHRMLTSLSSLSFILWIQPRLPWCSNPTRQYASLVLAVINWDGGSEVATLCHLFQNPFYHARSS